ncbi:MAG: YeeE/YedE family protein [Betaproteobacteria bacterium]|nr:YeeE/YedE family protein [Betaproteobacteria bacterium]
MNEANPAQLASYLVWGSLAVSFAFGVVANRSHFCTMGAVSDILVMDNWTRMRMWMMALAIAILGTSGLQLAGMIDVSKSIYATPNFTWLSYVIGGMLFGAGMTLASGCGSKTLLRIGTGNLKSLVVAIVMAITAYMTLRGILAIPRVSAIDAIAVKFAMPQDLPTLLSGGTGIARGTLVMALALIIGGGLLVFALRSREFRTFDNLLGALVAGLAIVAGWYLSGSIGHLAEDPQTLEEKFYATNSGRMESLSFVSPLAYSLELLMLWTDKSRVVTLGIATTIGLCGGAFVHSVATRSFRLESFRDARDLINHLAGGVLMGFGGVLALGCTIGQGLSGMSTLALGSFLALASIIAGSVITLKWQYRNA